MKLAERLGNMPIGLDKSGFQRLALIKYYFIMASDYAKKDEPIHGLAVLALHDSVELFLQVIAEAYGVTKPDIRFMEYWPLLKGSLDLTQMSSMRNLNKARVNFKHHGIMPSKQQTEDFVANVATFFDDNSKLAFDINFEEIDLIDLVKNQSTKQLLKASRVHLVSGDLGIASEKCAMAFEILLDEYAERKLDATHETPFYFVEDMQWLKTPFMRLDNLITGDRHLIKQLEDFINKVQKSLESIGVAVKISSFGIEYRKYIKFKYLTPIVVRTYRNRNNRLDPSNYDAYKPPSKLTRENIEYCIDFVIQAALKLDEFDFSV